MSQIESGVELLKKHLQNDLAGLELSQQETDQLLFELDTISDIVIDSWLKNNPKDSPL